jgi:hypothetical protein
MTYVRGQLGDRLGRQLARADRQWRHPTSGRGPDDASPKQMARSSARNLMKAICSQCHRLRDRRSLELQSPPVRLAALERTQSASVV